jgi:hypothetical protein
MAFPLMVRAIRLSIEAVDPKLEQAGATLGASPVWVFLTVTLPMALPGIVAGAILAFAKAMGEFGATITFVSNIPGQTRTIPSAIYAFLQVPGGESSAMTLVIVSVVVAMAALLLSEVIGRRVAAGSGAADAGGRGPPRLPGLHARCRLPRAAGGDGAVRALGLGQDDHRERGGGAADAGCRAASRPATGCFSTPTRASASRRIAAAWATSSRRGGCFRI